MSLLTLPASYGFEKALSAPPVGSVTKPRRRRGDVYRLTKPLLVSILLILIFFKIAIPAQAAMAQVAQW